MKNGNVDSLAADEMCSFCLLIPSLMDARTVMSCSAPFFTTVDSSCAAGKIKLPHTSSVERMYNLMFLRVKNFSSIDMLVLACDSPHL